MDSVTLPLAFAAGVITFASPCFLPIIAVFITHLVGTAPQVRPRLGNGDGGAATGTDAAGGSDGGSAVVTTSERAGRKIAKGVPAVANLVVVDRGAIAIAPPEKWRPTRIGATAVPPAQGGTAEHSARGRALVNALAFVGAFTAIFVSLWAAVSAIGWVVGDLRELLRIGGGIVLIILGLFAAGAVRIPALERTRRLSGRMPDAPRPTVRRSAMLGVAFGAGWSPCIGPVLGMILGMALSVDSALSGLGLLVVFCAGMGLPFVLIALGASGLQARLGVLSRHFRSFQIASGILMIAMGFLMIADLLAPLSGISWVRI